MSTDLYVSSSKTNHISTTSSKDFQNIMKTYLYNFDPLKPHFYIVKLEFTEVYIIFLISAQKHRLWVLVSEAVLTSTHNLPTIYVLSRNKKYAINSIYEQRDRRNDENYIPHPLSILHMLGL